MATFLKVHGILHHYVIEGSKDKPILVFANSLGSDLRIWDGVVAHLAGEFRIIRYDKRGHGLSDVPRAAVFVERFRPGFGGIIRCSGNQTGDGCWTLGGWSHCARSGDQLSRSGACASA